MVKFLATCWGVRGPKHTADTEKGEECGKYWKSKRRWGSGRYQHKRSINVCVCPLFGIHCIYLVAPTPLFHRHSVLTRGTPVFLLISNKKSVKYQFEVI